MIIRKILCIPCARETVHLEYRVASLPFLTDCVFRHLKTGSLRASGFQIATTFAPAATAVAPIVAPKTFAVNTFAATPVAATVAITAAECLRALVN